MRLLRHPGCRWMAAVSLVVLFAGSLPAAAGRTKVVVSVDVESNERFGLLEQVNATCEGQTACGLNEILRVLGARQWPGTFFLDVYEQKRWGEDAMRNIARSLRDAGHDVELHTHPHWMYDPTRWAMHQYSLEEQTRIIREGAQFLQSWTGQPVVAHRAGAYAADVNTLVALERNGIALDSSVFWKYEHTRLDGIGLPRNLPGQYGRVTEIPVSVYERVDHAPLVSRVLAAAPVVRKIDPNWYANVGEVAASIDALLAADVPLLVVFLHSYSFMSEPGTDGTRADGHALEMFHAVVDHIATKNLPVVTMRQLVEARSPLSLAAARDVVPRVVVRVDVPRYVWHRIRTVDRITLASLFAAIGLGTMLALWLMGKRLLSANRRPVVLGARAR